MAEGPRNEKRILGLSKLRSARQNVAVWTPSTRDEIDQLPALSPYPSTTWEDALRVLQAATGQVQKVQVSPLASPSVAPAQAAVRQASAEPETVQVVIPEDASPAQEIELRAEAAATVIRGMFEATAGEDEMPPLVKLGVLLVAIGQRAAGEVMKFLSDSEIVELTRSMATVKHVTSQAQAEVVEAFVQQLRDGSGARAGGMDYSRSVLERAVGPRKAQEILDRVANTVSSGFVMLKNAAPEQVAPFISHEHPQTIALILSQLNPTQGAGILAQLPQKLQADVAYRIATMENVTPAVLKEIEDALEASLRDLLGGNQDVGGPKVVADLLNLTGSSVEKNVLDQMDAQDTEVAESVRNLMFTFADIGKLNDREIQIVLRTVDQKDLVCALKFTEEALKERFLRNMTAEVRDLVTAELEVLGPMRLSEVEGVQLRIVQAVRQLEEQGQITIVRGDADDTYV